MKFTNLFGIKSQSVIDSLVHNDYDLQNKPRNVFSCTEVCDSPKNKVLQRRHNHEATIDISDNLHSMDGSAIHYVLEMGNKASTTARLCEERIFIDLTDISAHTMPKGGSIQDQPWYFENHYYVSFKFDVYEEAEQCLEDYKRTSVWEAKKGLKDARVQQLNINGYGMRLLGFQVTKLRACLFLKDWSAAELRSQETSAQQKGYRCEYPVIPYKEYEPAVWSDDECLKFLTKRVGLHLAAATLTDDHIPVCTPEERWYNGETFAIIKEGNQKATKLIKAEDYENREQALATAEDLLRVYKEECKKPADAARYKIEVRPGNDARCNSDRRYCAVNQWCNHWRETYGHTARGGVGEDY